VKYAVLGAQGRYYVQFSDGHAEWVGPPSFTEAVQRSTRAIRQVAFGAGDAWLILYDTGGAIWNDIPRRLHKQVRALSQKESRECREPSSLFPIAHGTLLQLLGVQHRRSALAAPTSLKNRSLGLAGVSSPFSRCALGLNCGDSELCLGTNAGNVESALPCRTHRVGYKVDRQL